MKSYKDVPRTRGRNQIRWNAELEIRCQELSSEGLVGSKSVQTGLCEKVSQATRAAVVEDRV